MHAYNRIRLANVGLEFTTRHVGADWILEGDMMSAITRSATVTTISKSRHDDIPLIDDEFAAPKHFRWVGRPGTPLEQDGPAGTGFRLEDA